MTRWEYETILMALDGGVPALADKLGQALQNLVEERNRLAEENIKLKEEKSNCECSKDCSEPDPEAKAVKQVKSVTKKID